MANILILKYGPLELRAHAITWFVNLTRPIAIPSPSPLPTDLTELSNIIVLNTLVRQAPDVAHKEEARPAGVVASRATLTS